jgi:hypothetical protein
VEVRSRFGKLELSRQVIYHKEEDQHVIPGNAVLPAHEGIIVTRGLQEWACLLPQDLSFASAQRLLGWQTGDDAVLSESTLRNLVRQHGQLIRQTEQAEVEALLKAEDLSAMQIQLVPYQTPRRRAGWPEEMNTAVETALEAEAVRPPKGVSAADGERVLEARREETARPVEELRHLGPEVAEGQVLMTTDEVLTRKPEKRRFWELRTARIVTPEGYRYLSGVGDSFLQQVLVLSLVLFSTPGVRSLLLIGDGARWIRNFFADCLAWLPDKQMILDWYHVRKKVSQLGSMIYRGRKGRKQFLGTIYRHLWQGEVEAAIQFLETYRPQARNGEKLDELIAYLHKRRDFIPNYRQRRRERRYIGSAHAEKANDLIVARRQKRQGMHWSLTTSDALAALKTLMLNDGWERYWQQRQVLPLVA